MISEILKRSVFVTAFLLSCQSAQATAQPENADGGDVFIEEENVAEPAEHHVMIETIVMLDGKKYVAEVEHVLYDSDELVSVYHQPDGTVSDPIPRRREFAIEVYLRPVGMKITDRWTALRLNAPRFEPNATTAVTGARAGTALAATARVTIFTATPWWPWISRPGKCSGTTSSSITTSGTGTIPRRRFSWI